MNNTRVSKFSLKIFKLPTGESLFTQIRRVYFGHLVYLDSFYSDFHKLHEYCIIKGCNPNNEHAICKGQFPS